VEELPKVEYVDLHYMNVWFSTLVDNLNFDIGQIESAVSALAMQLNTLDTAPIQYLEDSIDKLVDNINKGFEQIEDRFRSFDERLRRLGG